MAGLFVCVGLSSFGCAKGTERRKIIVVQPAQQPAPSVPPSSPVSTAPLSTEPVGTMVQPSASGVPVVAGGMPPPGPAPSDGSASEDAGFAFDETGGDAAPPSPVNAPSSGSDAGDWEPTPDAPLIEGDCALACAAAGAECVEGKRCEFDCSQPGACSESIVCPDGFDCSVKCEGEDSCTGHVQCPRQGAESCEVTCGQDACKSGIECGGTTCSVKCADGGCHNEGGDAVSGGATTFNLDCWGNGSCSGGLVCNATNCNLACNGSGACSPGNITMNAENASLSCNGNGTCSQEINCNSGNCNVGCNTGAGACSSYCANRSCN